MTTQPKQMLNPKSPIQIKLCGFTEEQTLQTAIAQKCDFLGFIFYEKSPRYITPKSASLLLPIIPSNISKVAVVVDPSFELLEEISKKFQPDFFQFHGSENIEFLKEVRRKFSKTKIIKAFQISQEKDLEPIQNFEEVADIFLLDSKTTSEFGGSGKKFDWTILQRFHPQKDWFLSGGLNIDNIEEALKISSAKLIDISSGIEEIRGKKSSKLIENFMTKVRNLCC